MIPVHVAAGRNTKNAVVCRAVFSFGSTRSHGTPASLDAPQSLREVAPFPFSPSARRGDKRYPAQGSRNTALRHGRLTQRAPTSYTRGDSASLPDSLWDGLCRATNSRLNGNPELNLFQEVRR